MKKITKLLLLLLVTPLLFIFPVQATTNLSPDGARAFEDLARCLNSKDTLDVFYLIDESRSLLDTDSENKRAPILAASLRELIGLKEDLRINYAVGFFGNTYSTWLPWTELTSVNSEKASNQLEQEVAKRFNGRGTDWLLGVKSAEEELRKQRSKSRGCQILIWLTDGGITGGQDYGGAKAFGDLCSKVFNSLRQSRITVLGVLLKSEQDLARYSSADRSAQENLMSLMAPLVEGRALIGSPAQQLQTCGTYPIPANYSAGALLIAENPISLAYQFLRLGSLLSGGTAGNLIGNPGKFLIEEGVARFRIVTTSSTWTLTGPDGQQYQAGSGIEVTKSGGATQISVPVTSNMYGQWQFGYERDSDNQLILFSGLRLKLDSGELVAGSPGSISGSVAPEFGNQRVNLSVFGTKSVTVQEVLGDGTVGPERPANLDTNGDFQLANFTPSSDQGQLEIRVVLEVATKSGIKLAPVSISRNLDVRLPKNYPSLTNSPVQFSVLKGANGEGLGEMVFRGPATGNGKVCLSEPKILSDPIDRKDAYKWGVTSNDIENGCLALRENEEKRVQIAVRNGVPANAEVLAELPVTYFSDSEGKQFTLGALLALPTQISPGAEIVAVLLTILGFLLPLFAIYLMTLLSTKIAIGNSMQRGQWKVSVDSLKGISAVDGGTLKPTPEDFKFLPELSDARKFEDSLGVMHAKVSKLVFPSPWFELESREGTRAVTMVAGPARAIQRFKSGKLAPIAGNLDNIWALSINENDLRALGSKNSIPAELVIFKRNNLANKNQYMERYLKVTTTAGIWSQIQSLAQAISAEAEQVSKGKNSRKAQKTSSVSEVDQSSVESGSISAPPPPPGTSNPLPPTFTKSTPQPPISGSGSSGPINPIVPPPPSGPTGFPPKPPGA